MVAVVVVVGVGVAVAVVVAVVVVVGVVVGVAVAVGVGVGVVVGVVVGVAVAVGVVVGVAVVVVLTKELQMNPIDPKRQPDESFEDYKQRRKQGNAIIKFMRKGDMFYDPKAGNTLAKGIPYVKDIFSC